MARSLKGVSVEPTRREFLKAGALLTGAAVLPRGLMTVPGQELAVEAFQVPLTVPPVLTPYERRAGVDRYRIAMRRSNAEVIPGSRTPVWGYNGRFPGPTIRVESGKPVVVRQMNRLDVATTVHLHGGHVSPGDDGHPMDLIAPGRHKDYHYPNDQPASTLWYHDHTHRQTGRNVNMGLAGLYIIEDDVERGLNLPSGEFDVPLVLQDRKFNRDGSFFFRHDHNGNFGDVYLVNGRPMPFFEVAARKYRFRLVNASNSRIYDLALDPGFPMTQIASDGGLLPAPNAITNVSISPAERIEVVIDFSLLPLGTSLTLRDRDPEAEPGEPGAPVMRFDVTRQADDTSTVPAALRPVEPLPEASREREFELSLDFDAGWVINGKGFGPNRIDARPRLGEVEVWRFNNLSTLPHPMHLHQAMFQILDREGTPPPPGERGWKDTVRVDSAERVRIAVRFTRFTGDYVFHCHNLAHEDHAMMAQMRIRR